MLVEMRLQRLQQGLAPRPLQRHLLLRRRAHFRLIWKSGCVPQNEQGGTKRLHRLAIRAPQIAVSLTTCTHGLIITRGSRLENPVRYHPWHPPIAPARYGGFGFDGDPHLPHNPLKISTLPADGTDTLQTTSA